MRSIFSLSFPFAVAIAVGAMTAAAEEALSRQRGVVVLIINRSTSRLPPWVSIERPRVFGMDKDKFVLFPPRIGGEQCVIIGSVAE